VHVFAAGITGIDPSRVGTGVPRVNRRVELQARVTALPGCLRNFLQEVARPKRFANFSCGDKACGPRTIFQYRLHKIVSDTYRIVGVLEEYRAIGSSVYGTVIASVDKSPGFFLFFGFALNKFDDIWVVRVEYDHLRGTSGFAAGFDHSCRGV